jgi:presequence protease
MPFHQKRAHPVPELHAVIEEYEDPASGARHIHVQTDDPEMAFLVAIFSNT